MNKSSLIHRQLSETIADAKAHVKKMKKACPYLFPEYTRMVHARTKLEQAKDTYEKAKTAWKTL